jgi:hypothetical protein
MKINLILGLALIGLSMIALPGSSIVTADLQVVFSSSIEETSENQQQGNANGNGNGASAGSGGDDGNGNGNGASAGSGGDDGNGNGNGASAGSGGNDGNDNNDLNPKLTDAIKPNPTVEILSEEQQQEQQQVQRELTMEIINFNGLIPVNDTSSMDKSGGDGVGNGDNSPTAEKVTCVKNDRGEVFCYEELKPIEHCLKPIKEEDPPLCLRGE